ncbi:LuxR family transcriptional regulator [Streptomyces sp. Ag109_G2-15]|uniref:helix-turn-helix transcriptional regulator n=1 Tax=Streptomyces sp. Ag109_G2-15 TaxID=1938850 RepID=UPI000BD3BB02|nr:LuxR family transcriptional regulator [Streptomyces sp. Ag109_G2-15]SOE07357.1 ATP-, maltotriose- and DNA-dependent transcriptional regulator MalT [Streptomyces sp. Ag109_G2-15]
MGVRVLTGRHELLDTARAELTARPGVLFHGPAGIGKSMLVAALMTSSARQPGGTVLHCSPAEEDARLPFVGLIDLFARVPESFLGALPPEPRAALRAALMRGRKPDGDQSRLALRVAVVEVLRTLAAAGPVLLVVDGLQWLDEPSAEVLTFAVRRVGGLGIRVLATERVAHGEQPERLCCCPPGTVELPVPPLTDDEVADLVRTGIGADLPSAVMRAIQDTAAGNPWYALELGQVAPRDGASVGLGRTLPVPRRLRSLLLNDVHMLPEAARHTLLVTSAAARPSLTLLRAAGIPDPAADLAAAERLGVATADAGGTVRFGHPLIRAAVYADAPEYGRREAHALLARAVTEPVEQARHLALAHPYADEDTARTLMSAAEYARRDGAAAAAFELAGLAARRTPGDRPADHAERLLAAAEYACDAGQLEEAGQAAETVLAGSGSARQRVRARLILLRNAGQALQGARDLIEEGLRDADGDPEAEAWLHYWAAVRGLLCGELEEAARHARRAARQADRAGDPDTRIGALATLARVRSLAGDPAAAGAALEEALALAGGADAGPESWGLIRMRAILALDSDQVTEAGKQVTQLLAGIGELAGVEEVMATLVALTRIQVRSGHCREALRTAARCTRALAETGVQAAPALYAAALAATAGGTADEARRLAEQAVRASEADGDRLFLLRALAVLGQAELLAGDPRGAAAAVEALQRVKQLGEAMCAADPPLLHWYGDLAEALVVLGETDAAGTVLREARTRVSGDAPGSVLAALERAEGLREAGLGRAKEGAVRLRGAVDRLRRLPLPVELVRTLIALGTVERRSRRRSAARTVLGEALETATRIGAAPLAARARDELARLEAGDRGGETGAGGPELTPTEARIAELVGGGATNREVAAELFISVKTVEGTLSRVYRKLGVRSRTALAHAMAVAVIAAGAAVPSGEDDQVKPAAQSVTVGQSGRIRTPRSTHAVDVTPVVNT